MKSRQSIQNCDKGFTVLELLVSMFLGILVLGLLLASVLSSKNLYRADVIRTRINQDLRGALDIIGSQVRISGENFSWTFPAILVENNWNGDGTDRLTLRRNLLDEILKVCSPLAAGTYSDMVFATGTNSGCIYADNTHNFNSWSAYRTSEGGAVDAYVFNSSSRLGEFFRYTGETSDGVEYSISPSGGTWQNSYDTSASAAFIIEEWIFEVADDTLRLIVNGDTANPLNVTFGIVDFQVTAIQADGTELTTLDSGGNWTDLRALRISLTGQDTFRGKPIERTLSTEFFPRNVLSN